MSTANRAGRIERIASALPDMSDGALAWVTKIVDGLGVPITLSHLPTSDIVDAKLAMDFGDVLRVHHSLSNEPFTKDKFEYALVNLATAAGISAMRASRGNPGHDVTVSKDRISLKTQADRSIKPAELHISKFMELGKGAWTNRVGDLDGLRAQFLEHLKKYDRILVLRSLSDRATAWHYELVEIPIALLMRAANGQLRMMGDSKQMPMPGYCDVHKGNALLFQLYFDGGTERKLQIKRLSKDNCTVHAEWSFAR